MTRYDRFSGKANIQRKRSRFNASVLLKDIKSARLSILSDF